MTGGNQTPTLATPGERELIPLSLLNDYLYCPRRAGLKIIEGWRSANEHTARGDIAHEHADLPGYEVAKGVKLLRALPVFSERLGLNGKCDLVEISGEISTRISNLTSHISDCRPGTPEIAPDVPHLKSPSASPSPFDLKSEICNLRSLKPVEFKVGKRRQFDNDDAQLCAQALCLEEMFGVGIPTGAVFHADSKRRREVVFTPELREFTQTAISQLRELAQADHAPPAVYKPACAECSLFDICLPKATSGDARIERIARGLFEISNVTSHISKE